MIYHYFLSANGAQGYTDLTARRAKQLRHVMRTAGYPASVLRAAAGAAMQLAREQGVRLDIIHRPLDGDVTGMIVPATGSAIFNTPSWMERGRHVSGLLENSVRDRLRQVLGEVYRDYADAKQIHDEWEAVYLAETDFAKLDAAAEHYAKRLFDSGEAAVPPGVRYDAFFGAATPDGPVDYIDCLTADIPKRYFLKGRPGTGKSTFLKRLTDAALSAGADAEVYHCSFDSGSLDLLISRARGVCVFDSTSPHEYFPVRGGDEIIDLYAQAVRPGTDERHVIRLGQIAKAYKERITQATALLLQARTFAREMETNTETELDRVRTAAAVEEMVNTLFTQ